MSALGKEATKGSANNGSDLLSSDALATVSREDYNAAQLRSRLTASIRQQIEFYFSDENLRTDSFLLWKMSGPQNLPVPMKTICRFAAMRGYHDLSLIIDALADSKVVKPVQIDGAWHIERLVAFPIENKEIGSNKKIKAARNKAERAHRYGFSTSKSKSSKPTGFEEYYAEPPITPETFQEEQDLYHPDRSIFTRLETAIQRYCRRRNFVTALRVVFDRWMNFGGITSGPKQFTGADKSVLEDMAARQIDEVMASNFMSDDALDESKMVLDFEGVIKAFLSCVVPVHWDVTNPAELARCINVPRNFYNYILHHDVVPEHREAILAARAVCDKAEQEFPLTLAGMRLLPGRFNVACSVLFGGQHSETLIPPGLWSDWSNEKEVECFQPQMTYETAKEIFESATDITVGSSSSSTASATLSWRNTGLEVIMIQYANDMSSPDYKAASPFGRIKCRPWTAPDFAANDIPPSVIGTPSDPSVAAEIASATESYTFLIEDKILSACCFVGMKIEADVYRITGSAGPSLHEDCLTAKEEDVYGKTDGRVQYYFFDNVRQVLPSFYKVLENELNMSGRFVGKWREPRVIGKEEHEARDEWIRGRGVPVDEVPDDTE